MKKKKLLCLGLAMAISSMQILSVGAATKEELQNKRAEASSQLESTNANILFLLLLFMAFSSILLIFFQCTFYKLN